MKEAAIEEQMMTIREADSRPFPRWQKKQGIRAKRSGVFRNTPGRLSLPM